MRLRKQITSLVALAAFSLAGGGGLLLGACPSHDSQASVADHGPSTHADAHHDALPGGEPPADEHQHDGCTCVETCCETVSVRDAAAIGPARRLASDVQANVGSVAAAAPDGPEAAYLLPFANAPPLLV